MNKERLLTSTIFGRRPHLLEAAHLTRGWRRLSTWLPAALACVAIILESTATMSARHTDELLRPFFERIFGPIDDAVWWWAHHLFRKGGHFTGYGLVCLTFLRAWLLTLARQLEWSLAAWRWRSVLLAIGCTFLVASCDEWHQTYLPSRTGQFSDVVLDTVGASVMCLAVALVFGWTADQAKPASPTPKPR